MNFLHTIHCVGGCCRLTDLDLTGKRPNEVTCPKCHSPNIAIWKHRACIYSYTGRVDYPMWNELHGRSVRGPNNG